MADQTTDKVNLQLHLLEPRATEKSYLEQTNRIYVFPVKLNATKQSIAKMVEKEQANLDYTHINFAGGRHLADLLFEVLMQGKENYDSRAH